MSDHAPITLSIKSGTGYDAALIAVKANTADEARDILGAIESGGLLTDVGRVAHAFAVQSSVGGTLGGRPVEAPQQAQQQPQNAYQPQPPSQGYPQPPQAPQGGSWGAQGSQGGNGWGNGPGANPADAKACIHGPMTFKPAGVSRRTNQPYAAFWACASNVKGCKAIN